MFELNKIDRTEKRALSLAIIFVLTQLFVIAYAAVFLGNTVPTCQPDEKLFEKGELRSLNNKRYEVHYLAKMWTFEPRRLVLPIGATVDFFLASKDVNHGFHINQTTINLMAVPGVVNKATYTFNKVGTYFIVCHEYCGLGHQNMNAQIIVADNISEASSDLAVEPPVGSVEPSSALTVAEQNGKLVFEQKGCVACHTLDGKSSVGPTFKGLWNKTEELQDGSVVVVDEKYITESIEEPLAKIVKGFGPTMPKLLLPPEDIKNLIEYIKTVK